MPQQKPRSLLQYAFGYVPKRQQILFDATRNMLQKHRRITPEQVKQTKKTIMPPQNSARSLTIEINDFAVTMRRNLQIYLENDPDVPLDILSNFYMLFEHNLLRSQVLTKFRRSSSPIYIFESYVMGGEDVAMLLKYNQRIYFLILQGKYSGFLRNISHEDVNELQRLYQQGEMPREFIVKSYRNMPEKNLRVAFAIPVTNARHGVPHPVPFQEESSHLLSYRTSM